jgi:hypothetical protein
MRPKTTDEIICSISRLPRQWTTTYGAAPAERLRQSFVAPRGESVGRAASQPLGRSPTA